MRETRLDHIIYLMIAIFFCSLLGVMHEIIDIQNWRVEVEREHMLKEKLPTDLMIATIMIGEQVDRLRGMKLENQTKSSINCIVCH